MYIIINMHANTNNFATILQLLIIYIYIISNANAKLIDHM